jgi:Flp pilus assembly protein TadG
MRLKTRSRRAATMVEFALVGSLTFLLIVGLIVGGAGVFRFAEVASIAREASRQASVHGTQYAKTTKNNAWTQTDVYNNVIEPQAVALNLGNLTYSVSPSPVPSPYQTVTVTITYQWIPEAYLGGITLTSTSTTVVSN